MRILAIDHGSKRMGLAVTDELGLIAQPLAFIPAEPLADFFGQLREILCSKEVRLIVVGMPRNMDGSYGAAAGKVKAFIELLREQTAVPIRTWDERLTSVQAHRALQEGNIKGKRRKETVDQTAAALLLQGFLESGATS